VVHRLRDCQGEREEKIKLGKESRTERHASRIMKEKSESKRKLNNKSLLSKSEIKNNKIPKFTF